MFEKLDVFEKRLEEINQKLCDPAVLADQQTYTELFKGKQLHYSHCGEIPGI